MGRSLKKGPYVDAKLYMKIERLNSGGSKRAPLKADFRYTFDNPDRITVKAHALDHFLAQDRFDFIFMDIEGSEYFALAGMPRAVGPCIDTLLRVSDPQTRVFTINLLGDLRHEQVTHWLLQVLSNETCVNGVAAAVDVLAKLGQPEHIKPLQATRQRFASDPFLAFTIDVAIERIRAG